MIISHVKVSKRRSHLLSPLEVSIFRHVEECNSVVCPQHGCWLSWSDQGGLSEIISGWEKHTSHPCLSLHCELSRASLWRPSPAVHLTVLNNPDSTRASLSTSSGSCSFCCPSSSLHLVAMHCIWERARDSTVFSKPCYLAARSLGPRELKAITLLSSLISGSCPTRQTKSMGDKGGKHFIEILLSSSS